MAYRCRTFGLDTVALGAQAKFQGIWCRGFPRPRCHRHALRTIGFGVINASAMREPGSPLRGGIDAMSAAFAKIQHDFERPPFLAPERMEKAAYLQPSPRFG